MRKIPSFVSGLSRVYSNFRQA